MLPSLLQAGALLGAFLSAANAGVVQTPFKIPSFPSEQDAASSPQILTHPSLPAHSLRVTQPPGSLCERAKGTRSWSGYLDVDVAQLRRGEQNTADDGREDVVDHLYFWAFESRSNPKTDPVLLWLNGGPGCSSFTGLLQELGPCNILDPERKDSNGEGTEWNEWSWNSNATVVFLDQPVGVGFSYSSWAKPNKTGRAPHGVYSTPAAARDTSAFLQLLGMHVDKLWAGKNGQISSFHFSGESYAGRYLPLLASQVLRDNEDAIAHPEHGLRPVPLRSVLIGNGITSPRAQFPAYVEYACTNTSGMGPFLDDRTCGKMWDAIPVCQTLVKKCNDRPADQPYDSLACTTALTYCEGALSSPWDKTGMSPYDNQHPGDYAEEDWVAAFLNSPSTQAALGVDKLGPGDSRDGTFVGCSDKVYKHFASTGDGARDSTWAVRDVLEKGVRVLAYSGKRDFICNYIGNEQWALDLDWPGASHFRRAPLEPWYEAPRPGSDPKSARKAGDYRHYGNFTFVVVDDAGHFVPYDQPAAALTMVNRWLTTPGDGSL